MLLKAGKQLHGSGCDQELATLVAHSLAIDLGQTHQAVKTAMRWSGASERTVKHWLAGTHAPSGPYLVSLIRHSDALLKQLLVNSGRSEVAIALDVAAIHGKLSAALAACEEVIAAQR